MQRHVDPRPERQTWSSGLDGSLGGSCKFAHRRRAVFPDTRAYSVLSDGDDAVELSDDDGISLLIFKPPPPTPSPLTLLRCTMRYSLCTDYSYGTQTLRKGPVKNNSFKLKLEKKKSNSAVSPLLYHRGVHVTSVQLWTGVRKSK